MVGGGLCRPYGAWNDFLGLFSTNMSPLWSFGAKRPSREIRATPPRPSPPISLAERERGDDGFNGGFKSFHAPKLFCFFKRMNQPNASGFLAPQTKCGERIKERGNRNSSHANIHQTFVPLLKRIEGLIKLSATPPRPSPAISLAERERRGGGCARVIGYFKS